MYIQFQNLFYNIFYINVVDQVDHMGDNKIAVTKSAMEKEAVSNKIEATKAPMEKVPVSNGIPSNLEKKGNFLYRNF